MYSPCDMNDPSRVAEIRHNIEIHRMNDQNQMKCVQHPGRVERNSGVVSLRQTHQINPTFMIYFSIWKRRSKFTDRIPVKESIPTISAIVDICLQSRDPQAAGYPVK